MAKIDHRSAPRPGGRSARVRATVLRAAFDALQRTGYSGLSIADVAQAAGVHETTIYRRWKSPAALALDATMQFVTDLVGVPDTGSLRGDLIAFGRDVATVIASPTGQALLEVCRLSDPEVASARGAFFAQRFEASAEIFRRAARRGEIAESDNAALFTELLIAPLYLRALVTGEPLSDWPVETVVNLLLQNLAAPARDGARPIPSTRAKR